MNIAIVTPWLDHLELAEDYIAAVALANPSDELLIVDDGSNPPLDFASIRLFENQGFVRACNAGLRAATADAVLFLNNDIRHKQDDWLEQIRATVEPGVLVGPRLRYDRHGQVDGLPYPYLDGWCLAGMRADLLELGGFDEHLLEPSYYSDNILAFQARAAGMSLREVRVGLEHKVSQTTGGAANPQVPAAIEVNFARYQQVVRETLGAVAA